MSETDRQTDTSGKGKSSRWAFTAYESQWSMFNEMPPLVAEWGWQKETCPTTQREHYQGYLRTKQQVRLSQLLKTFPGVHFEISRNWPALVNYCKKSETAEPGTQIHQVNSNMRTIYSLAKEIATCLPHPDVIDNDFEEIRERVRREARSKGEIPNYDIYNVSSKKDYFLSRVDAEVRGLIRGGNTDVAWLATNPQWLCMWNKYGVDFLHGIKSNIDYNGSLSQTRSPADSPPSEQVASPA